MRVGVLAVQGDFAEHVAAIRGLGHDPVEVRLPGDLQRLDGLIMPGGESTTFSRLMDLFRLKTPIASLAGDGMPLWGTCAGMIMMARDITEDDPVPMGLMDIGLVRNGYGRQVDSFEEDLDVPALGAEPFHAIFIRAPVISTVGDGVEVLAQLSNGSPVAVRQGRMLGTAFHPELTGDRRFHDYFLSDVFRA